MTKAELKRLEDECVCDLISAIPPNGNMRRNSMEKALRTAFWKGIEASIYKFAEGRDKTACQPCQNFLDKLVNGLRVDS